MGRLLESEAFRWIAGGLLGALVLVCSWAFATAEARVSDIEATLDQRTEQLARLETHVTTQQKQLDRVEDKLDWIIELEATRGSNRRPAPPGRRLRPQP